MANGDVSYECLYDELLDPKIIKLNPRNTNIHDEDQLNDLAKGLRKFEFRRAIILNKEDKECVCGEGTVLSAIKAGIGLVPVVYQSFKSKSYAEAYGTFDNAIKQRSKVDKKKVNEFMLDWGPEIDFSDLGIKDLVLDPSELPEKKKKICKHCGEET